MHTKQSFYDLLCCAAQEGLLLQRCAYRWWGEPNCPVGLLIPDDEYTSLLEGKQFFSLPEPLIDEIIPSGMDPTSLYMIQWHHDFLVVYYKHLTYQQRVQELFDRLRYTFNEFPDIDAPMQWLEMKPQT